jgi:dihydroxy-acid dehydratase
LITDGRFSGVTAGLSIGHITPEAATGGLIGYVKDGDTIEIDIPNRTITLCVSDGELAERKKIPYKYVSPRVITNALELYRAHVGEASDGGARILTKK